MSHNSVYGVAFWVYVLVLQTQASYSFDVALLHPFLSKALRSSENVSLLLSLDLQL